MPGVRVNYSRGSHLYEYKLEDPGYAGDCLAEVKQQVDLADVVILAVGMDETIEGEEILNSEDFTGDKKDLRLPETQRNLIRTVIERNKPVILVNMTGSAVDFEHGNYADAIIQAWYPGAMGGKAIADLIFGAYSPSGRLPVTFYSNANHLPAFEDYSMENRTYKFFKEQPLYPFGYGLSYTTFTYSDLNCRETMVPGESVSVSVTVKNTGRMASDEIVEIYLRDEDASVRVPVHKLVGCKRIFLQPDERKKVTFTIDARQFCIINEDGEHLYEAGFYTIYAGGSQPDPYSQKLTGQHVLSTRIRMQ